MCVDLPCNCIKHTRLCPNIPLTPPPPPHTPTPGSVKVAHLQQLIGFLFTRFCLMALRDHSQA